MGKREYFYECLCVLEVEDKSKGALMLCGTCERERVRGVTGVLF